METESLTELFEPYSEKIAEGGNNLIEGFNELCYVTIHLKPYPKDENSKEEK